ALVLNAAGGSLDSATVALCAANARLKVINGSENLVMPNPDDEEILRRAKKIFCPCECAGMMGYLTAAEEYLSHLAGEPFAVESMYVAAKALEAPGERATQHVIDGGYALTMTQAMQELYG
ncbi:MAG: hypothetical protein H3C62_17230, partial [Gemmatimonadaceae bacterium]|nr:hypothetical protein [Gemmatimonadaceae bacterium]